MSDYPFLSSAFLDSLEHSGSVGPDTGWLPAHVRLEDAPDNSAFMPTYVKTHSWGEYVFDWAWADAYQRNGLDYYPKLVSAIPFSPATGPRVVFNGQGDRRQVCQNLFQQVRELADEQRAHSWHLLFPDADTLDWFQHPELMLRTGVQYHWLNRGYESFEHFLAGFASRKRKMVKRERRRVGEQGIDVELLAGSAIDPELWRFFYQLYQSTYRKRSGNGGYLSQAFFLQLGASMADNIAMAVARKQGQPIACALYFHGDDTLYGRYWGCAEEYDFLHFELCYYQGIEYAIQRGLQRFDAGAQGEHKIVRGFEPLATHSLHWIRHPGFATAIGDFLDRETVEIKRYIEQAKSALPYKQEEQIPS
ncbi:GNAT family N-acetyltransferase [Gammaproteobacteria bacterium 53_120_T64]|nr:GNAT family N-acetyltransferase [Gammaproteobacteria bacterium 53_120_T64]